MRHVVTPTHMDSDKERGHREGGEQVIKEYQVDMEIDLHLIGTKS